MPPAMDAPVEDTAFRPDIGGLDGGNRDAGSEACVPYLERCDGVDNDCDPSTPDGVEDTRYGMPCDGPDTDMCRDGTYVACVDGALTCDDTTGDALELCDGIDNDCNFLTPDGQDDSPGVHAPYTVGHSCNGSALGTTYWQRSSSTCNGNTELHIFTMYEASGDHSTAGPSVVEVNRTVAPIALVLSSYESVAWEVRPGAGVVIEAIVLNGYGYHSVTGAGSGVTIHDYSGPTNYLVTSAYRSDMANFTRLVSESERILGHTLTSANGCYQSELWRLD